jgi:hypothetical protein
VGVSEPSSGTASVVVSSLRKYVYSPQLSILLKGLTSSSAYANLRPGRLRPGALPLRFDLGSRVTWPSLASALGPALLCPGQTTAWKEPNTSSTSFHTSTSRVQRRAIVKDLGPSDSLGPPPSRAAPVGPAEAAGGLGWSAPWPSPGPTPCYEKNTELDAVSSTAGLEVQRHSLLLGPRVSPVPSTVIPSALRPVR